MKTDLKNNLIKPNVTVGRICYANVAPVYYGLDNGLRPDWLKIVSGPPATLNCLMAEEKLDISPVSSAAFAENHEKWHLLPENSISCMGEVMSVLLVSRYPFSRLENKKIALTDDSSTAALLLKLIFSLKKIFPRFETRSIHSMNDLGGNDDAALIIGDTALKEKWKSAYEHVWDLGNIWYELTGHPFVFAVWAARKSFTQNHPDRVSEVLSLFRASRHEGALSMEKVIASASGKLGLDLDLCKKYYDCLLYDLDPAKLKGLATFWEYLFREKLIPKKVEPSFFCEN